MLKMSVKLQEWALGRGGDFVTKQAVREKGTWTGGGRGKGEGKKPEKVNTPCHQRNDLQKKEKGIDWGLGGGERYFFRDGIPPGQAGAARPRPHPSV